MPDTISSAVTCAFCEKSRPQVGFLIQGVTANICSDCVTSCAALIAERGRTGDRTSEATSALREARSHRGKVLSLEADERYAGHSAGVTVHRFDPVTRETIVLPASTLELMERNVIGFARARDALSKLGMPVKKGLLFHGAPGTGKTHAIRYLSAALPDHTTFVMTAERIALLKEYIAFARLLQPAIVVIEDADLLARKRTDTDGPCEESRLHRVLHEMDGLPEDAQILFVLTTNRPEALEPAVVGRPGRIDQAIEFPLPDFEGRRNLARIYAGSLPVAPELLDAVAMRTHNVSPAFVKELMRRTAQFYIEGGGGESVPSDCLDRALHEMLVAGERLNLRLLGGEAPDPSPADPQRPRAR